MAFLVGSSDIITNNLWLKNVGGYGSYIIDGSISVPSTSNYKTISFSDGLSGARRSIVWAMGSFNNDVNDYSSFGRAVFAYHDPGQNNGWQTLQSSYSAFGSINFYVGILNSLPHFQFRNLYSTAKTFYYQYYYVGEGSPILTFT